MPGPKNPKSPATKPRGTDRPLEKGAEELLRSLAPSEKFFFSLVLLSKQGSTPTPLVAGSARPNPKMGAPDPEKPSFLGVFYAQRGIETVVSGGGQTMG